MKIDGFGLLYLLGGVQGFLLMIGININQPFNTLSKRLLSLLLFTMTFSMVYYLTILNQWSAIYPYIDSLGTAAWMSIAPLYYLLLKSLTDKKKSWRWIETLYLIVPIWFILEEVLGILEIPWNAYYLIQDPQLFLDVWMLVFFTSGIGMTLLSLRVLRPVSAFPLKSSLLVFTWSLLLILLCFAIAYLFVREDYNHTFEFILIGLFELFSFSLSYRLFKTVSFKSLHPNNAYSNQTMGREDLLHRASQLDEFMKANELYLNKDLKLSDLSKQTNIKSTDLSMLFSQHYQTNFYQYINDYRLEYLQKLLRSKNHEQYTIAALAELSGFKSKASFYKAFKNKYQMTPSEYLKSNK